MWINWASAYKCCEPGCGVVHGQAEACPRCGSRALLSLARVLHDDPTETAGKPRAKADEFERLMQMLYQDKSKGE